jgi:hypothetical protein
VRKRSSEPEHLGKPTTSIVGPSLSIDDDTHAQGNQQQARPTLDANRSRQPRSPSLPWPPLPAAFRARTARSAAPSRPASISRRRLRLVVLGCMVGDTCVRHWSEPKAHAHTHLNLHFHERAKRRVLTD